MSKFKVASPTSSKTRSGKFPNGVSYQASRRGYANGAKVTQVSTYKESNPLKYEGYGGMKRVTSQTKITGEGRTPQIDIVGKGAHKKLERVGLRKAKAKK